MRKAALPTVFRQLVLEGRNQKEAARRCRCSKSLISVRVKVIQSRFGMSLERLQRKRHAWHLWLIES